MDPFPGYGDAVKASVYDTLKKVYGHHAFRTGQEELVERLMSGGDVLGIMPTGSGKSLCYQIPALLLPGTTLVISPLISLMKDQVTALRLRGIPSAFLNSSMDPGDYQETAFQAVSGDFRILYVAPERLQAPGFLEMCQHMDIPMVAVDEAHCISQWGQDFRPSYLKIPEFIRALPVKPVVGAFTATATPNVRRDILTNLQLNDPLTVVTGFDRPNLSFSVFQPKDKDAMLAELLRDRYRQSGIIYCATRKNVESVCSDLCAEGFSATRYHAGLSAEERRTNQEDFLFDRKRIMVATNAFGMGIDKSNVSFVIHYNMPKSLEAYYQEAGRAGRDGCDADCILLYSAQDVVMGHWLIDHSEPNPDLTPAEQAEVKTRDEERLKWMTFYARSRKCLRHDLLRYFGEDAPDRCENCSNCVPDCEHVDITTEAQMILSNIVRTGARYTEETNIRILRGEMPDSDLADTGKLTTFGLMKDTGASAVSDMIRVLLNQGYLDRDEEGILKPNSQSNEILRGTRRVVMKKGLKSLKDGTGEELLRALERVRYDLAAEEHVAASSLLADSILRDLCRSLPRTKRQLGAIDGMGVYKAEKYGDRILPVIRQYSRCGSGKAKEQHEKKAEKKTGGFHAYKDQLTKAGTVGAYQPWTTEEDQQLVREYTERKTVKEMAEIHQRTRGAIRSRLKEWGLDRAK